MSFNRENLVWQSPDGTWNQGFYDFYPNEDYDDDQEWGVEYTGNFHSVSSGHYSEEAAYNSHRGPNPGGYGTLSKEDPRYSEIIRSVEDNAAVVCIAADLNNNSEEKNLYKENFRQHVSYSGKPRKRKIDQIAKDYFRYKRDALQYEYNSFANVTPLQRFPKLEKKWGTEIKEYALTHNPATDEDARFLEKVIQDHKTKLEKFTEEKDNMYSSGRFRGLNHQLHNTVKEKISKEIDSLKSLKFKKSGAVPKALSKSNQSSTSSSNQVSTGSKNSKSSVTSRGYHINPETGRPNKCYAVKKPCPYGKDAPHYPTKEKARAAYEKDQKNNSSIDMFEVHQKIKKGQKLSDKEYSALKNLAKNPISYEESIKNFN